MLPIYISYLPYFIKTVRRFHEYKPQRVTFRSMTRWLKQFDRKDLKPILELLDEVIYLSEKEVETALISLNDTLLDQLSNSRIPPNHVIYIQVHEAGSSSPVILNMLRDGARLERKGCKFLDSKDVRGLINATNELEQGAIVYVDDFAGSGTQFCDSRDFAAQHIVGNFAEFFLLPCICEEALQKLEERGIEPKTSLVHRKQERPLHPESKMVNDSNKQKLIELCMRIDRRWGLGYQGLATMVVLYRNAPNSVPLIFRGSQKQYPWKGLLPRTTDLPP